MLALEIIVNGHHIQTISAGEMGMVTADLMANRLTRKDGVVEEDIWLHPRGLEDGGDHISWANSYLKVGDVVTIRIVEVDASADPPSERLTREELERLNRERRDNPK